MFERLLILEAVRRETVDQCPVPEHRQRIEAAIGDFISVAAPVTVHGSSRNLGQGEQGVLALAQERRADFLLMDDRKAANEAGDLGLQCAYTTDVLRLAEHRRIIESAAEVVADLRDLRIFLPFASVPRTTSH